MAQGKKQFTSIAFHLIVNLHDMPVDITHLWRPRCIGEFEL